MNSVDRMVKSAEEVVQKGARGVSKFKSSLAKAGIHNPSRVAGVADVQLEKFRRSSSRW